MLAALDAAGLRPAAEYASRFPHELSGGQRQRVVIAGALVMDPEVIVADEPVSMLDVSIRTELLRLMLDLRRERGLTYLFITHDLSLAWVIADRIAVMYLGRIMEIGTAEHVIRDPRNPYTEALVSVSPSPEPPQKGERSGRTILKGETPDAVHIPTAAGSTRAARRRSTGAGSSRHRCSTWAMDTHRHAGSPSPPSPRVAGHCRSWTRRHRRERDEGGRHGIDGLSHGPGAYSPTMPRRAVRILVLVWFGAMVATAPARVGAADADRILRVGTTEEFDSINPNLAFVGSSAEATNLDYDVLVGLGPELEYAPTGFAESWSQDGTTWTFTIRDGMRWSDGRVADANDVAFTFRYILASMDPAYIGPWAPEGNDLPRAGATRGDRRPDNPLSLYGDVLVDAVGLRSVELVDDRTVRLTTVEPTTLLLGALVPILPAHVWSTVPFARAATDFQAAPPVVGSGPFQAVEWQRGTSARFLRNPHYWGKRPYVEEVEFRFYPDQSAMAAALRRGEIDYARDIAAADVEPLDEDAAIVAVEGLASGYTHLAFNVYGKDDRWRWRLDSGRSGPDVP